MLHHRVSGAGQPLILLHGLFGMGDNLSMIARPLSEHFEVYQLDLRNHGRSPRASSMTFSEMAGDVLAFMDSYQLQKPHVLGHSLGGKVAMQLALEHPDRVDRLVLADIAPVAYNGNHDEVFAGLAAVDLTAIGSRRDAEEVLKAYIAEVGVRLFLLKSLYRNAEGQYAWRMNYEALQDCYEGMRAGNSAEQAFGGPTLFIKGENSAYIQEKYRDSIEQLFPNAQLKEIQDTGHWLHAEKTETFNTIVMQFLSAEKA